MVSVTKRKGESADSKNYWIGLWRNADTTGIFMWSDGETLEGFNDFLRKTPIKFACLSNSAEFNHFQQVTTFPHPSKEIPTVLSSGTKK